jgi:hypothetical protein
MRMYYKSCISLNGGVACEFPYHALDSPLYTIPATAGVAACSINVESGVITLEYRFKEGGRLHVKRDSRIEFTEQVARIYLASEKS